jgi:hypothetical protein
MVWAMLEKHRQRILYSIPKLRVAGRGDRGHEEEKEKIS